MKILVISDEACPALWDYYVPGRLADYQLIISCGDLKPGYLSFLVTMARCPVLYVPGNHDEIYERTPPEGCDNIDGKVVEYNGLRIMGLGGCRKYHPGPYQYTDRDNFNIEGYSLVHLERSITATAFAEAVFSSRRVKNESDISFVLNLSASAKTTSAPFATERI